jgi:4-hydroxy-3-polyprenylbenzoate decarboxylase
LLWIRDRRFTGTERNVTEGNKLVIGITGATGTIYGVRLLQLLQATNVETRLVMSTWGAYTLVRETPFTVSQVQALATKVHIIGDQGAEISSGSAITRGMVIAPCSMKTLACIASGAVQNLIHRAADITLKERRKLVLLVREAPLNDIHLENMLKLSRMGAVIYPPVPSFYNRPDSLDDMVTYTAARVLDQFGIHLTDVKRWEGAMLTNEQRTRLDQLPTLEPVGQE